MTIDQAIQESLEIESKANSADDNGRSRLRLMNHMLRTHPRFRDALAIAVKALDFYSCENNWHITHPITCLEFDCCHRDQWNRAKEAQAAIAAIFEEKTNGK